jgi:hypothetical protein
MGGQSHGNVQKQGGSAVAKDSVNEKQNTEFTSKVQPTPEQIRLATMIQDSSRAAQSDEETASKIKEVRVGFGHLDDRVLLLCSPSFLSSFCAVGGADEM